MTKGQHDGLAGAGNLTDRVYEAVKRDIVECRLQPDEILVEVALAERFDVSRAPAREALQRLTRIGFVRAVPRLGYIVTGISVRDFDEIFQTRLVLEPLAAELATERLTDPDAQRLDALAAEVGEILAVAHEDSGSRLTSNNAAFHREVARISGNGRLERLIGGLIDELERVMRMLAYDAGVSSVHDEHRSLVRAMRSGDPLAAAACMREQLVHDRDLMRDVAVRSAASTIHRDRTPAE
jgi:DNA-binding GntR family transcriptional regulator